MGAKQVVTLNCAVKGSKCRKLPTKVVTVCFSSHLDEDLDTRIRYNDGSSQLEI